MKSSVREENAPQFQPLQADETFRARLIEGSQDCIKVLDLDGRLLSMNAGGMKVLEICDLEPFVGSYWADFWKGSDRAAAIAAIQKARNGGVGRFVGFFPTTQTRKPMWFDVVVSPIIDSEGRPEKLVASSRDVTDWKRSEELLRAIIEGTAEVTGESFFKSLVKHLAEALHVRWVFVGECLPELRARTLAYCVDGTLAPNIEYDLRGTPCLEVAQGRTCHVPDRLSEVFPDDKGMIDMGTVSYLGVPLRDSAKRIIGHLVTFDDKPMPRDALAISVLETFANRAGAELERERSHKEVLRLRDRLAAENAYLQEEIRSEHNFDEIVGNSPTLLNVLRCVDQVASTDSTVLILGETGTGKELIARAVHDRSDRKNRPLVKVNCGAISAGLVESELFGHVKGAFTGALTNRDGRFKLADGGTIFLDEVGELPLDTQVKLLRVLQEQEFEPIGSSKPVKVDVRVIAATNRDLSEAIREGKFRSDLFYRLNVVPIKVPSLHERAGDVPLLTTFFLQRFAKRFNKPVKQVSEEAMRRLCAYHWPGNIRELQNVIERAVVLATDSVLTLAPDFHPQTQRPAAGHTAHEPVAAAERIKSKPTREEPASGSLEEVERRHIESVLQQTNWMIEGERGAARILNLNPSTLRSRMQKLSIKRPGRAA